jgi:bifunctional DNA-binding transcriptional regulator/antitoxin component of YhaV-PrlF toxin-antitoxin module
MTQTKISRVFQTTISAEAIRMLGLRPGMRVNQFVEGKRLILEPLEDATELAGSLGRGKKSAPTIEELKRAARQGVAGAGMAGLEAGA